MNRFLSAELRNTPKDVSSCAIPVFGAQVVLSMSRHTDVLDVWQKWIVCRLLRMKTTALTMIRREG